MNLQTGARSNGIVLGLVALVAAGLEIYAQTRAFAWDEGFHLVTAQSINRGKRPYLDFCFPQTPLNAYWNAGWMCVFGDTWRSPHAVAAVMTALAVLLTAGYVLRRFPAPGWGLGGLAGLLCSRKRSGWERAQRREFYLCAWLAVALMVHISTATPTFRRYYLLAVPFLAILACAGLYD